MNEADEKRTQEIDKEIEKLENKKKGIQGQYEEEDRLNRNKDSVGKFFKYKGAGNSFLKTVSFDKVTGDLITKLIDLDIEKEWLNSADDINTWGFMEITQQEFNKGIEEEIHKIKKEFLGLAIGKTTKEKLSLEDRKAEALMTLINFIHGCRDFKFIDIEESENLQSCIQTLIDIEEKYKKEIKIGYA